MQRLQLNDYVFYLPLNFQDYVINHLVYKMAKSVRIAYSNFPELKGTLSNGLSCPTNSSKTVWKRLFIWQQILTFKKLAPA